MDSKLSTHWLNHEAELLLYAQSKLRNKEDAEDLMQDVFEKLSAKERSFSDEEMIKAYLFKVLKNAIIDHFRKQSKQMALMTEWVEPIETADKDLNQIIASCCIRPLLQELDPLYREALWLTQLQNFSQKELAEHLGVPHSTIKSRVQRGKLKLKEKLTSCCSFKIDKYGNLDSDDPAVEDCVK